MCGITGFIEFNSDTTTSDVYLSKMVEIMHRRGPDASNFKLYDTNNYKVGLGHARLSVIDLSDHATQPFTADEQSIVFNGEIYNFQEIKDELIGLGYHFLTTSDTEVVLKTLKLGVLMQLISLLGCLLSQFMIKAWKKCISLEIDLV